MAATPQQTKDSNQRTKLMKYLTSGISANGFPITEDTLVKHWPVFLDLHFKLPFPGRAVASLDVEYMLEHKVVGITEGRKRRNFQDAPGAASSTDGPVATPRKLSDLELSAIGAWLEKHRAETPSGAAEIRATEVFYARRLQWSGAVSP